MSIHREIKNTQALTSKFIRIALGGTTQPFISSGFEVTDDGGLDVSISAGVGYIRDADNEVYQVTSGGAEILTMSDDATNYVYLHTEATYLTSSTSATVPDDAILLATVVTEDSDITSIVDGRIMSTENKSQLLVDYKGILFEGYGAVDDWFTQGEPILILYLNELQTRKIKLLKLKFNYYLNVLDTGTALIKTYYNIGAGNVELDSISKTGVGNASGTKDLTINQSTSAITDIPYIKFYPYATTSGTYKFTISKIYLEYEYID